MEGDSPSLPSEVQDWVRREMVEKVVTAAEGVALRGWSASCSKRLFRVRVVDWTSWGRGAGGADGEGNRAAFRTTGDGGGAGDGNFSGCHAGRM